MKKRKLKKRIESLESDLVQACEEILTLKNTAILDICAFGETGLLNDEEMAEELEALESSIELWKAVLGSVRHHEQ